MKWLSNRYTYPLIAFTIAVCYFLQLLWIFQLYKAQRTEIRKDLETIVSQSAAMGTYLSVVPGHEKSDNYRKFFLSPQWVQFQSAFNEMRFARAGIRYNSYGRNDSAFLSFEFGIKQQDSISLAQKTPPMNQESGIPMSEQMKTDLVDRRRLDSLLEDKLRGLPMPVKWHAVTRPYADITPDTLLKSHAESDGFYSPFYSYNFRFLNLYQVVVPSIRGLVMYRIRYYIYSSMLLVLLTAVMLLFLVRLIRNQKLYAEARLAFTSNMTHELKTPVSTISLALESIDVNKLENDPQTMRSYIAISQSELAKLNQLIDKSLQLDQFDFGKNTLRTQLLDIGESLSEVVQSMNLQVQNAGAVVTLSLPENPVFVNADPVHLTSVFSNLIENALKYSTPPIQLDIRCVVEGTSISISFQDNGPGIESIYQKRVFDRFYRVPSASGHVYNTKGTGLGLNYVRQVVEQHGGKIRLKSARGKGSNFIIWLPLAA